MPRTIFITSVDLERLQNLIRLKEEFSSGDKACLQALDAELKRAVVTKPDEIPQNVITMRSQVILKDLSTGEETIYTLVYPEEADIRENKISVLAPIGTAILGYQAGDIVDWEIPDGIARLRVEKVIFQPEASGNFDL